MIIAELSHEIQRPISLDTDAGLVYLTKAEAQTLAKSLEVCLAELNQLPTKE